jgi:hypothetical protein
MLFETVIPLEICINILKYIDPKTYCQCRYINPEWSKLITDPGVIVHYLLNSKKYNLWQILIYMGSECNLEYIFRYYEYTLDRIMPFNKFKLYSNLSLLSSRKEYKQTINTLVKYGYYVPEILPSLIFNKHYSTAFYALNNYRYRIYKKIFILYNLIDQPETYETIPLFIFLIKNLNRTQRHKLKYKLDNSNNKNFKFLFDYYYKKNSSYF